MDLVQCDRGMPMVVVLGMHRSGTSAITNILSKAGFFVGQGPDLITQAKQWNRDGYFERWSILKTNDQILSLCGGSWKSPPKERDIAKIKMDAGIQALLATYSGHDRTVIKDPRMCLTFPVWDRVLDENTRIILIRRHPDAVAASLFKRDGFSWQKSFDLQKIYNERASRYAKAYPSFTICYEDLFSSRRRALLLELAGFLEIDDDLEHIANHIIDPSLQHHAGENSGSDATREYEIAGNLIKEGRMDEAIATLECLLGMNAGHAAAFNDLGVLYFQKGQTERALTCLQQSLRLEPDNAVFRNNLAQLSSIALDPVRGAETNSQAWHGYPKFMEKSANVLLVSLRHMLLHEIKGAIERTGHNCRLLMIEGEELSRRDVERMFTDAIKDSLPDFVLTVNHLGFDQEGVITDLLTGLKIPFASWYVDSPHLIIHHYARNKSPYLTLFLWDRDYVDIVKSFGFERVEYLPLGVDETLFRPIQQKNNPLKHMASAVSFVGNSMVLKIRSVLARSKINGSLLKNFHEVSASFNDSRHLVVRNMMAEKYPELARELLNLEGSQAYGYETAVTWMATLLYREDLVKKLLPYNPLIAGDKGWQELLPGGVRLHRELNYYQDLNAFYNVSGISFNATSRQMKGGVNQRVFDVPAAKGVVMTDWTPQLEELMEPGREVLAYRDGDEIREILDRALKDKAFRNKVAEAGYRRVLSEHTYSQRIKQLINVMKQNYEEFSKD